MIHPQGRVGMGMQVARSTRVTGAERAPRRGWRARLAAIVVVSVVAFTGAIASPAAAIDYPSWDDLQKAKGNTAAAQAAVDNIRSVIAQMQQQVADLQAAAAARADELQVAQDKFDAATIRATQIQAQADASKAAADAATKQAGQLAAQLYRTGGNDLSANLVFEKSGGKGADALLSKLGSMSKLGQRSSDIYKSAQIAANAAAALGAQAKVAQDEREKLRVAAEAALEAAVAAQKAAEEALAASQAKSIELDQQLKFMQDAQAKVAADYQAGVVERQRLAAIAAAAAAAAAAASGGGPGAGLGGGYISNQGWAVPASGRMTDGYGSRTSICTPGGCSGSFHYGADLAPGCSAPIYAAHSGTVVFAGSSGTYGNFVKIDHGSGIATGYAHIRSGGIFVSVGQQVDVGQNIASVGSTGASTGCHLHFEVFQGGNRINPVPFMASMGAPLG